AASALPDGAKVISSRKNSCLTGLSLRRYPHVRHVLSRPYGKGEASMGAKRYGPPNGSKKPTLNDYHQSKDELAGLPQTVAEKVPVTSTPNIFSYKSYVFAKNPALVQRYIKATKADVGGVGGHVVAADEVKSVVAKFVLDNNGYRGEPIFT